MPFAKSAIYDQHPKSLNDDSRLLELSQMLGEVGEGTLRSAHELMQVAREMIKVKK